MGYKFQFITLAGFHALNMSTFELARRYATEGMLAYSDLQEREFAEERESGYRAVKHQKFVGTGYFDDVAGVISGGLSSTMAMHGSTEEEQFTELCHADNGSSAASAEEVGPRLRTAAETIRLRACVTRGTILGRHGQRNSMPVGLAARASSTLPMPP